MKLPTKIEEVKPYLTFNPDANLHFFYGGFLSQWFYAPFYVMRTEYLTAEHYMMHKKAELFGDNLISALILNTYEPSEVKKLGKQVQNFDIIKWNEKKFDIVVQGNWYKFHNYKDLKRKLLATGDSILVEASPTDRIWGIGRPMGYSQLHDVDSWRGENLLGFALMKVREKVKNEL